MSPEEQTPGSAPGGPEDAQWLAGEYVLGLLEGEALAQARERLARDPAFAGEVAFWEDCFGEMLVGVPPIEAPAAQWPHILDARAKPALPPASSLQTHPGEDLGKDLGEDRGGGESRGEHGGEHGGRERAPLAGERAAASAPGSARIIDLQKRLSRARAVSSLAMAAAASLALVALLGPGLRTRFEAGPAPAPAAAPGLLAANIPLGDTALRLALVYVPGIDRLTVSASGLVADGVHDHELWLVDRRGALHSLGVIAPGREASHAVDAQLAQEFQPGARLLLTREPLGGKPADRAAGPVVAEGQFAQI